MCVCVFSFQLAASMLMQRHKLYYFSFVPIGLWSLELSQQPQLWDCCFSQFDSISQEARLALNCLVTIQPAWVARMTPGRVALLLSEESSIQKHPFAMVLEGLGHRASLSQFLPLHNYGMISGM